MKHSIRRWLVLALPALLLAGQVEPANAVRIVTYNLSDYSDICSPDPCRSAEFAAVMFDVPAGTEPGSLSPDLLILQEVVGQAGADKFVELLNSAAGSPGDYVLAPFTASLTTALAYRSSLFDVPELTVLMSGGNPAVNRWRVQLVQYESDEASFYVYGVQAAVGTSVAAQQARLDLSLLIRTNAASLSTRFLIAGDLQVAADNESSYGFYTTAGGGQTRDPLNPTPMPGSPVVWTNNAAQADKHTHNSQTFGGTCPPDCGMNNRFDFQLLSNTLFTPTGNNPLVYVAGTKRAYGNDAGHFHQAIDAGGNAAVGSSVAGQLRAASDHLPVYADYQVPAKIGVNGAGLDPSCTIEFDLGKIRQGQNDPALDEQRTLNVANIIDLSENDFVETLVYTLDLAAAPPIGPIDDITVAGGFPINDDHDAEAVVPPAGDDFVLTFPISDAATLGAFGPLAALEVASNDLDCPAVTINVAGEVIPFLNVRSNNPGAAMTVTDDDPDDLTTEDAQGTTSSNATDYTLGYDVGTIVTLVGENPHPSDPNLGLVRWEEDGVLSSISDTAMVTMSASKTIEALYGYVLDVDANVPATPIEVTDDAGDPDVDGQGTANDGNTPFARSYEWEIGAATTVTLTAPDPHPSNPDLVFLRWEVDGVVITTSTMTSVVVDAAKSALAVYGFNLDVNASVAGTSIDVTDDDGDADADGRGTTNDGNAPFQRSYDPNTTVSLTAPATESGQQFMRWDLDGTLSTTNLTDSVLVDAAHTSVAQYGFQISVDSNLPGVMITVTDNTGSPALDGTGVANDGTTPFDRLQEATATITLEAPATFMGQPFDRWDIDGAMGDGSNPVMVPMASADHTAVAVYVIGLVGDIDMDNDVDNDDLALLVGCLTGPGGGILPGCDDADLDTDGDVDLADFALLMSNFTGPGQACCLGLLCENRLAVDCGTLGGLPLGVGTVCGLDECPESCCLPDGTCTDTGPTDCAGLGGIAQGLGTNCTDDPCPVGACCQDDGSCSEVVAALCTGSFAGVGNTCAATICDTACCHDDGTCTDESVDSCNTAGGDLQGIGSECASASCPAAEACCMGDGTCSDLTVAACAAALGISEGPGTDCGSTVCPQPEACCMGDGSCDDLTPADCTSAGGTPDGPGTDCGTTVCPQPTEACCMDDGTCDDLTAADCTAAGGTSEGPGSDCGTASCPAAEACCLGGGACSDLTPGACTLAGGTPDGPGTDCGTTVCP